MLNKKLKNIILDFDGVIVDTYELVFDIFREKYPKVTHSNFQDLFDTSVNNNNKMGLAEGEEFIEWFFDRYNDNLSRQHIFSNVTNILEELSGDYKLFLITSNSEKVTGEFLRNIGLNIFTEIMGYETNKLKVEKFKILEEKGLINKDDSIFITDTLADVVEGKDAGYVVVAETFGYHTEERLRRGNPDVIVNSWQEIINFIKFNQI